ncbi:hypothetical protein ACFUIY_33995 [Streptomyces griseorubiginosus]|uniref:hypothetical protein n=1 Tax=Streptomyces griseorubiginosus TaxID=67304 RepID=UPI003624E607
MQLRNLFGERGRHPYADRIEADRFAQGDDFPKKVVQGRPPRTPGNGPSHPAAV